MTVTGLPLFIVTVAIFQLRKYAHFLILFHIHTSHPTTILTNAAHKQCQWINVMNHLVNIRVLFSSNVNLFFLKTAAITS